MFDLILKLLDRSIQLLNARKAAREAEFDNNIVPLFAEFEALHKDYLQCFLAYRVQLGAADDFTSDNSIIEAIQRDHLFSQDLRSKIEATFAMLPESPFAMKFDAKTGSPVRASPDARDRDSIEEFIYAITCYIVGHEREIFQNDHFIGSNAPRSSLISGLKYIFAMSGDDLRRFVDRVNESPCVFIINPQCDDRDNYYLFACFFTSTGGWGIDNKPSVIWKELQNRISSAHADTTEIQRAISTMLLDNIVYRMQYYYRDVVNAYASLKKKAKS